MEGFEVLPMEQAAPIGDIFCTATGDRDVIRREHLEQMKDGTLLANSGHSNVEIDLAALRALGTAACACARARRGVRARRRPPPLPALGGPAREPRRPREGQPPGVMDMSFANQALSVEYALQHPAASSAACTACRREIDAEIARLKLASMRIEIDRLSEAQLRYLESWDAGAMRAFVMAAGLGTRLSPITDHVPKPLVPVANRPALEHLLARLPAAGIARGRDQPAPPRRCRARRVRRRLAARARDPLVGRARAARHRRRRRPGRRLPARAAASPSSCSRATACTRSTCPRSSGATAPRAPTAR